MLALRFYPLRQQSDADHVNFSQVCEAYDVLSDPTKKAYYDRYGMYYLKNELFPDVKGGYAYHNDSESIYKTFFESADRVTALTSNL